jgi:hypothetical protein
MAYILALLLTVDIWAPLRLMASIGLGYAVSVEVTWGLFFCHRYLAILSATLLLTPASLANCRTDIP